jgi:hypothetical protein
MSHYFSIARVRALLLCFFWRRLGQRLLPALLLGSCLIAAAPMAHAATYYVSTSGKDSNPCSSSAPCGSIDYAVNNIALKPGDTIIVADGTYYESDGAGEPGVYWRLAQSGASGNPITIKAQNNGKAIIDGSTSSSGGGTGVYIEANYATFVGFGVQHYSQNGMALYGSYVTVKDCTVNNNGNSAPASSDMGMDGIFSGPATTGIMIDSNIVYENGRLNVAGENSDQGIYLCSNHSTIQNNLIYANTSYGIQLAGYDSAAGHNIVTNNTIAREKNRGAILMWGDTTGYEAADIIQNNVMYDNNTANPTTSPDVDFLTDGGGHVIRNNLSYGNPSGTIGTSDESGSANNYSNNLTSNPMLTSDYHLEAGSPAIGSGYAQYAPAYDLSGATRSPGSVDLGCYAASVTLTAPTGLHLIVN